MRGPSVVVSFDAKGLIIGDITAQRDRMVVRQLLRAADIQKDSLALLMEVDHGAPYIDTIIEGLQQRYEATVKTLWDDPDHWRARIKYHDLSPIHEHPVYGPLHDFRQYMERGVLHIEDGLSIQRYDLVRRPDDLDELLDRVRERTRSAGIDCMVRTTAFDESILHWSPMLDPANRPGPV